MTGPFQAADGGRNFGFGRDMSYAGRQALEQRYGGGHFSTVGTHSERWGQFCAWAKDQGIRDLAKNDPQQLLVSYAENIRTQVLEKEMSPSYGQNLISSTQVTMRAMAGDQSIKVSPREYAGARHNVRTEAPAGMDRSQVDQAAASMRDAGLDRAAAVAELARELGVRESEAALAPLDRWAREADRTGTIQVTEGAKGGRTAERLVPVTERGRAAIEQARAARPAGSRNLLAQHETKRQFVDGELARGREHLAAAGLSTKYHELRAAYACERYQQLTGHDAPAVAGCRMASQEADHTAREQIAHELGHGRIDVCVAYVGSGR